MLNIISNPDYADFASLCTRPAIDQVMLTTGIQTIFNEIKRDGDTALLKYTAMFDNVTLASSIFDVGSMEANDVNISSELKDAIRTAYNNIFKFHSAQIGGDIIVETMPGIICTQKSVPISKVGIYIPGGTAPLFSTVLMLAIPAKIAGCEEIILCTPPDKTGSIHPAILFTAMLCGIKEIRLAGGAQAIAALTFGTDEIPAVDKIFGPGNQYVTAAKKLALNYGVSIDMPAGPSEVLVYADDTAIPAYVAADLLAQAEHGGDSQVILVASEMGMIDDTLLEIKKQVD
ncbi:MAG: histidinol dehydrogenase, partial [Saprospiraceae bacterium]